MKYRNLVKTLIIIVALAIGLTGCEGPGPEYQTPMTTGQEADNESLSTKLVYQDQDSYRQPKQENLRTVLLFDSGQTEISSDQKNILRQQANYLKRYPGAIIQVEGHTDAKGKSTVNYQIATKRANETSKFLRMQGISIKRIEIHSYGSRSPSQLGRDKQSDAKNRRVELIILPGSNGIKN